jgi:hypothetical protein
MPAVFVPLNRPCQLTKVHCVLLIRGNHNQVVVAVTNFMQKLKFLASLNVVGIVVGGIMLWYNVAVVAVG